MSILPSSGAGEAIVIDVWTHFLMRLAQTYRWLQAAYDDHAVWMTYLAVDPVFDRLRSDQRFQEMLRRVH